MAAPTITIPPNLHSDRIFLGVHHLDIDIVGDSFNDRFKRVYSYLDSKKSEVPGEVLKETEILLVSKLPPEWTREKLPNLKWIQLTFAGMDHVISHPLMAPHPTLPQPLLTGMSGIYGPNIGEHVLGFALSIYHSFPESLEMTHRLKSWKSPKTKEEYEARPFLVRELGGKTMGILGYGNIGRETARLAKAFGMNIIACTSRGNPCKQEGHIIPGKGDPDGSIPSSWHSSLSSTSFTNFLSQTDVLVSTIPSTLKSRHLLNYSTLSQLKSPESIVINVGRGTTVDTEGLLRVLDEGKIFGAGLDVVDPEPLEDGHRLFTHERVILTYHTSGTTDRWRERVVTFLRDQLQRLEEGKQPHNVYTPPGH